MQNGDQMHPQDMRNLILFGIFAIGLWIAYDHFVAKPHQLAIRQAQIAAQERAALLPPKITASIEPLTRKEALLETQRVFIDTPSLKGSINLTGARFDDLLLKDYYKTEEKTDNVALLSPPRAPHPEYIESGWISAETGKPVVGAKTLWALKEGIYTTLTEKTPIFLQARTENGLRVERKIEVDDHFGFTVTDSVFNEGTGPLTLYPYSFVRQDGLPEDASSQGSVHEGAIGYLAEELEEKNFSALRKKGQESFSSQGGWIGLTTKYWLNALVPVDQTAEKQYRMVHMDLPDEGAKDRYQTDMTGGAVTLKAGESSQYAFHIFSGPKKVSRLEGYEKKWGAPHFNLSVDFGLFYFLTRPFFWCINMLYHLTGNFGIAVILFTCLLRVLVFPLANTSYRSFAKLRKVSPEMYEIRAQYKDDKPKLQEELVKLYQKHNVNPMAGCLPILVQIPIFFALYKVLSNTIEMRHAPFFGWIQDLSAPDPTTVFNLFGLIPWDPPSFLMIGVWPLLMLTGMIIQQHISPAPDDPIQAKIIGMMPYVMTFIMAGFASGLVIYWTINNLLAIIQQVIIMRSMDVPVHLFSADRWKIKLAKQVKEGPAVFPSEQIIEQNLEHALLGEADNTPSSSAPTEEAKPSISAPKPKKKKKK